MIADDSKNCKGNFASGSMPDDKSPRVKRVFTGCDDKQGAAEYRYTIVPMDDGGFYLFATMEKSKSGGDNSSSVNKADVLLRNAVYEVLKR